MGAFALQRKYELQLPSSFVDIDRDEMEYVDGGVYISHATLWGFCKGTFLAAGINPVGATLVALGTWKVYRIIAAGWAAISARLGAFSGPVGWVLGIIGLAAISGLGYDIADALIQGKGLEIGIKYSRWGIPYGIDSSVK
ncbi:hypothetical protein [Fonticella tunisiensis]|uniref:Uncharacterized protein n=1 Tax=Fonticella tunisiensis TaxID=1096341 RepID=A0A4R7KNU9_9CLOT|nr:hypothetical protein [Fonticella tunisiensis]TDT57223.1 hypothetical protein EDD71_1122 [Fonticella tunisiensis]